MDYREAEKYVLSLTNYEKTSGVPYTPAYYDLRRMEELLAPLGNPHLSAKTVHVAGTKGKGSTSAMIHSVLKTAGYRTGLYTSPHLVSIRERFRVDDEIISEDEFAALITEVRPLVEQINRRMAFGSLTTFEVLTAVAFLYFHRRQVDYQVLEVGLGGRLDATNVVPSPEVCIITSISFDHMAVLGDTLEKIAREKAGIIKPGVPTVTAWLSDGAWQVVAAIAREKGSRRIVVGRDVKWEEKSSDLDGEEILVHGRLGVYDVRVPLLGYYQQENAALAIAAVEVLVEKGAKISPGHIVQGLATVKWPGRFQVLRHNPALVLDGAHNTDSMRKFVGTLLGKFRLLVDCIPPPRGFPFRPLVNPEKVFVICGMSVDKDIPGVVSELLQWFQCTARPAYPFYFVITRANHPRAADPVAVAAEFMKQKYPTEFIRLIEPVGRALTQALAEASPDGLVAVTGSLFVVGDALAWLERHPEVLN